MNREVAVKLMRDSLLAGPEEVRRFRVEATAAAKLKHPNIVEAELVLLHDDAGTCGAGPLIGMTLRLD